MAESFVHLHVHSQYSLLDGACRTADLIERAKQLEQPAIAITDHGCLFGVIDFYLKAKAGGVKPIIGIEAYMAPGSRRDRTATGVKDGGYHLLLLAADRTGYANLLKLASIAYNEGFYYRPRIDREVLTAHSAGLIATSACLGGEIPSALLGDNRKKAKEIAEAYLQIFGPERFFIELQKHIPEQDKVNPELMDLGERLGIGCVATNDVHFLLPDDHGPHQALCCIATGKLLSDESRLKYPTQLYLKSTAEMYAASDHPRWADACANAARIAAMCNLELDFKQSHAPVVKIEKVDQPASVAPSTAQARAQDRESDAASPGSTAWYQSFCSRFQLRPFDALHDKTSREDLKKQCDAALRELAEAGAVWRYGPEGVTDEHRARLDRELRILADKNISAYFLIVWDFVNEARRRGIPACARGSGVGTMVGYCLGLSNACPVRYGLLFERFTDPDRSEYPDIDIDICQDGRQEILDYVRNKYGHVAQIITFGSLKARAAIRDVGRVLNVPLPDVDRACKLVGEALGTTIKKALDQEPDLSKFCDEKPVHKQMIEMAQRLEGLSRHASVHAAGVVIATQPLDNIVPLYRPPNTDQTVTQWDGPTVEKVGLLKMDFLGLRTLSIIEKAKTLIRATLSPEVVREAVRGAGGFGVSGLGFGQEAARGGVGADSESEITNHKSQITNLRSQISDSQSPSPPNSKPQTPNPIPVPDPLDLDRLSYDDPRVLRLFCRGETAGVFQFESGGMRNLLVGMRPDRLEDLIAANALFRPGPMDLIPDYCERKHGRQAPPRAHPIVEQYTRETYGIMVYQEQVMQIVHGLGGIPLRAAYTLIKNISKKKQKEIDAVRPTFVAGARQQGLSESGAEELFELILKFAGYGFNKSHSTGYAIVAYQTAYLKTHFPIQYMAAVLTYESVSTDKVVEYIDACRHVLLPDGRRGIPVRPPDINLSEVAFTVVFDKGEARDACHGHIRFGLSAVKGVGDKAIAAIIEARQKAPGGGKAARAFASLFDFCERVPLSAVNRATIEALIKCGAFDSLHGPEARAALVEALDAAIAAGQRAASDRESGQLNFFAIPDAAGAGAASPAAAPAAAIRLPGVTPWARNEQLKYEKDVLGFYLTSHPLDQYRGLIESFSSATSADINELAADVEVVIGGMLTRVRQTMVKNGRSAGQKMAMITLEDAAGQADGVIFSDAYAIAAPLLENDRVVFVKARVDRRRERPGLVVNQVIRVEDAARLLTQTVRIVLRAPDNGHASSSAPASAPSPMGNDLPNLRELLRQCALSGGGNGGTNGRGTAAVVLEVHEAGQVIDLRLERLRINVDTDLPERVAAILHMPPGSGPEVCELVGPMRLNQQPGYARLVHHAPPAAARSGNERDQPRLRHETPDDEFCDSIDRY